MRLAKEGILIMAVATVVLGGCAIALWRLHWIAMLLPIAAWIWVISFFRDPVRICRLGEGEMCAPADGTVTEISRLEHDNDLDGPAIRVGIFLSLFNVHANRSPCDARVLETHHQPGRYLDARHPDSGRLNESNTIVLDVQDPFSGPVVVRQVAGLLARRIVCHVQSGATLTRGQRFGMIKFGSRTELIVPDLPGTDITVTVGDKVHAGVTRVLRQSVGKAGANE